MSEPVIAVSELNRVLVGVCDACRDKLLDELRIQPGSRLHPLLAQICAENEISVEMLLSKARHQSIVRVRRSFCKAATKQGYSLSEIGNFLGMHHTSVLHLVHS